MPKKEESHSELLIRIDERVGYIREDVRNIKLKQGKLFDGLGNHNTRLTLIEDKDKNRVHIPKNGNPMGKIIFTLLKIFR